ncbi:hypothetical protein AXF42_Ash013887 [Apostasia shenzhenica]|uniref:DUF4378 domain-containing protein n=1 Tax=Apostasia shenzhenica TaxID=1088818 RepID=A0A2I0AS52_9ASPA|nr:hypothetical protein AXF42_Ash013887 [Apostasia shenzhenica]
MGIERGGIKHGGFFHLFDWNRKSRKKLFSVSPENSKQEKRADHSFPGTRLRLVNEDETVGVLSLKGSSDYSCASSVTDEEGNGNRAPGIVARLMGLDSMPTSCEPLSTSLFDTQSLRSERSHMRSPEFVVNDQINCSQMGTEVYSRKPTEFRPPKMPSSPIERFQTETLPPRSAKPVSLTHHKLLSPIKNPRFISSRNASHIMEEAAKILEPALPSNTRTKACSSYRQSSIPLKVCEPKNSLSASQKPSKVIDSARRIVEPADSRYLKGQCLNRCWNGSEDNCSAFRASPDNSDKGKSISLAIQAKVNVQKRERLGNNSKNAVQILKDVDECKSNQLFKSQSSSQRNKQQTNKVTSTTSNVLRQNHQKQNCSSSKGKVCTKQSVSNQSERLGKTKTNNKHRKDNLDAFASEHEWLLSSNKDFPRKKRLIEVSFESDRIRHLEHHQKRMQSDFGIDEQSGRRTDNISDGSDVVSFTFTSPLVKVTTDKPSFFPSLGNSDRRKISSFDNNFQRIGLASKKLPCESLNLISGDALSLLLEQKLRELTFDASSAFSLHVQQEQMYENSFTTPTTERVSSTNGQVILQGLKEAESSSNSDARKETEVLHPSPLSILEATFSAESCNSSDSAASSTNGILFQNFQYNFILSSLFYHSSVHPGSKVSLASVQALNKTSPLEKELELSDSASSSSSSESSSGSSDLDYVKEILKCRTGSLHLALISLDPSLFDKLEREKGKNGRARRKMIFDYVIECLDDRCSLFLNSGYHAWAHGEAIMGKWDLAEEVYMEISRWKGIGDGMVDELVDRDMSSYRGRWVNFEKEAFELGVEMEKEIIGCLVDEIVTDCFHI